MGDYHVRFLERLGVKLPLSTRQFTVGNNMKKLNLIIIVLLTFSSCAQKKKLLEFQNWKV